MISLEKIAHLKFPHTQEIHFDNGETRVIRNVVAVEKGRWTHLITEGDGHVKGEYIINPDRVLFIAIKN